MVSFGGESLKRTVALVRGRLANPSSERADDLFGERTRSFRTDPRRRFMPSATTWVS